MYFVKHDNGVPISLAGSILIRFELRIQDEPLEMTYRASIYPSPDGSWIAWYNNQVVFIGEREDCVEALRQRGVNIQ